MLLSFEVFLKKSDFGDVSIFSFHATKNITTGEGGMVLTNNKIFAKRD